MQKWWTEESINDPWWLELLNELNWFTQPNNWYRWNIQRPLSDSPRWEQFPESNLEEFCWFEIVAPPETWKKYYRAIVELFLRYFQTPLHFACEYGLHLLLEYLLSSNLKRLPTTTDSSAIIDRGNPQLAPQAGIPNLMRHKLFALGNIYFEGGFIVAKEDYVSHVPYSLPTLSLSESSELLSLIFRREFTDPDTLWRLIEDILQGWEANTRTIWFANQLVGGQKDDIKQFMNDEDEKSAESYLDMEGNNPHKLKATWEEIITTMEHGIHHDPNQGDGLHRTPLYLGALNPKIVERLIKHGADVNSAAFKSQSVPTIIYLLRELSLATSTKGTAFCDRLLPTIRILLVNGASVDEKYYDKTGALHYAALQQDIVLFRQICQLRPWDILEGNALGQTPLHYLCLRRPPGSKIKDAFEIFTTLTRMKSDVSEIVNAQDLESESPLAYAIRAGFKEGISWLVEQKVDIHDDNSKGQNCFHHLAKFKEEPDIVKEIAASLLALSIDWKMEDDDGEPPLRTALEFNNEPLVLFLVDLYLNEMEQGPGYPTRSLNPTKQQNEATSKSKSLKESVLHQVARIPFSEYLISSLHKIFPESMNIHTKVEFTGRRPLHNAVEARNVELAQYILSQGLYTCSCTGLTYSQKYPVMMFPKRNMSYQVEWMNSVQNAISG
ncbi:hypothetical protein ABW20_dc0109223 [Dactylellina cionopaga]|nr:hypothetical protein ABW20_dc0109223 [Dactylellina cionopaga]